jgi:hypothetical protein
VARAGLVAALTHDALPGSAGWPVTIFRPRPDPITRLTKAAREWKNAGRDPAYLDTGARLAVAVE